MFGVSFMISVTVVSMMDGISWITEDLACFSRFSNAE